MCPQLLLQVRVDFGDVLNRQQAFGDILSDTAWLSQPRWQERLDLPQRTRGWAGEQGWLRPQEGAPQALHQRPGFPTRLLKNQDKRTRRCHSPEQTHL